MKFPRTRWTIKYYGVLKKLTNFKISTLLAGILKQIAILETPLLQQLYSIREIVIQPVLCYDVMSNVNFHRLYYAVYFFMLQRCLTISKSLLNVYHYYKSQQLITTTKRNESLKIIIAINDCICTSYIRKK